MLNMKRREFIALVGGGGLLLAVKVKRARGQQPAMPVIGFLWPMRLVIALLFLTIFASRCFAFGAYAVGYDAKRKQFESFLILNRSTAQEAEDIALRACQNKSFTDCAIKYTFSNTCIAIAFTRNRLIRFIDTDPSLEHARTKVMTACESSPGIKCFIGEAGCDRAKAFAPLSQSARDLTSGGFIA